MITSNLLFQKYKNEIANQLYTKFNFTSKMQIPKLEKIVVNMTAGNKVNDSKAVEAVMSELSLITGQKPFQTVAKKSLASWKIREKMPMGGKVTLRKERMWNFLQKMIDIIIPRIRDFRGFSTSSFDSQANYAFGIPEHIIFPEIEFDKIKQIKGLDVIIVTSTNIKAESYALLKALGFPFKGELNG
ncbi:MAG: 50S ribosomal protein L5 [Mycoplasma sp.]|nr:50S ribosomal protein L5 [Mycoplasma sp.]